MEQITASASDIQWYDISYVWNGFVDYSICCDVIACTSHANSKGVVHIKPLERCKAPNQKSQNIIVKSTTFTFHWVFNQVGE